MKLLKLKNWILIVSILALIFSCAKDEATSDGPIVINAKRLELVTLDLSSSSNLNDEYIGILGNENVKLYKTDTGKLSFIIPVTQNLGSNELKIENFSREITINVSEITLSDTPENIIQPLLTNFETFSQTLTDVSAENTAIRSSINTANTIFQNSSAIEKEKAAKFYLVNKSLIDNIVLDDFSNISGRSSSITYYDKKFYKAVLVMGVSSAMCILSIRAFQTSPNVFGATAVISGVVALSSMKKAKQLGIQTMEDNLMIFDHPDIDGSEGINDRNASSGLMLMNNTDNTLPFTFKTRRITSYDSNSTKDRTKNFFLSYNKFNNLINKLNEPIVYINTEYPSLSIPQFPLLAIADSSPVNSVAVTASTFSKISFSISHPNLQLVSSSLLQDGQMKIKAKIINSNLTNISSNLKYSYEDDFRKFTGTIPITVNTQSFIVGTWNHISTYWCGICESCLPEGQTVSSSCGSIIGSSACSWQWSTTFNNNLTGVETSCNTIGNFTYSINSAQTILTINEPNEPIQNFEILELNSTILKVKNLEIPNENRIITFQRQ